MGGIAQNLPCTAAIFSSITRPHLSYNHSWFNHSSLENNISTEKFSEKCPLILSAKCLCHTLQGSLTCRKIYEMGQKVLFPLRRKACSGFLSPLKLHHPWLGLNSRLLGPTDNTITTRPPRPTATPLRSDLEQFSSYLYWYSGRPAV
jgi:hypothetical protein